MCPVILPLVPSTLQENYTSHICLVHCSFFLGGRGESGGAAGEHGGIGSRRKQ